MLCQLTTMQSGAIHHCLCIVYKIVFRLDFFIVKSVLDYPASDKQCVDSCYAAHASALEYLNIGCRCIVNQEKRLVSSHLANDHTEARVYFNNDAFWLKTTRQWESIWWGQLQKFSCSNFCNTRLKLAPLQTLWLTSTPPTSSSFFSLFHFDLPTGFLSDSIKTHSPYLSKTDVQPLQFSAKFTSSFSSSPFVYLTCIALYRLCQERLAWNYGHPQSEAATMHDEDFKFMSL